MKKNVLNENFGEVENAESKEKKKMDENKKNIILAAIIGALVGTIITTSVFLVINSNKKPNSKNQGFPNEKFSQRERNFEGKGNMMEMPDDIPENMSQNMKENLPRDLQGENPEVQSNNENKTKGNINNDSQEEANNTRTKNKNTTDENV